MYIGFGYDVHRFKKGRPMVLGGVSIKSDLGLDGHSDADVLVHALMDSLLGAAGKPDIGSYFPNNDPRLKNISSIKLLEKVFSVLKKDGFTIINVDTTIVAEKPKIMKYAEKMKENISKVLGIPKSRIGVKATTNEGMGFIGRGEGISAMSVASLERGKRK